MRRRVIIEGTDMNHMTPEEQEKWWKLSRTCDVFERDVNGILWQILDCTEGIEDEIGYSADNDS